MTIKYKTIDGAGGADTLNSGKKKKKEQKYNKKIKKL